MKRQEWKLFCLFNFLSFCLFDFCLFVSLIFVFLSLWFFVFLTFWLSVFDFLTFRQFDFLSLFLQLFVFFIFRLFDWFFLFLIHWRKSNKCNQCNDASSYVTNLKRHLKTNSGQKSRTFNNQKTLKKEKVKNTTCYVQVLLTRYFQSHLLHIIVVYRWVMSFAFIYKY